MVDLVFYELRGDWTFQRSEWAGGTWTIPPRDQLNYRPDPSRIWGDTYVTWGWFLGWTSRAELKVDAHLTRIKRNPGGGSIAERALRLHPRGEPLAMRWGELLDRWHGTLRSRLHSPGTEPSVMPRPGPGPPFDDGLPP